MARVFAAAWLVLAFPLVGLGGTLVGTVIDPQHRVMVGAQVTLSCGRRAERLATDPQGRFEFPARPSFEHCSLAVRYPAFAAFEQVLDKNPAPLSIELRLAVSKQEVRVRSKAQELSEIARSSLGSVSLSDADLKGISNDTQDLIRYAKALAGAEMEPDVVYVDGLRSTTLPPAEMVARIDVNTDPFSAEYSDNGQTHINITTKSADRRLRFNFGGAGLGFRGRNVLAPGLRSVSDSASLGLIGPAPHAPLTFSLRTNLGYYLNEEPIQAVTAPDQNVTLSVRKAPVVSRNGSALLNVHYSRAESSQVNFSYSESRSTGSNVGVGGLTLPDAGTNSRLLAREARVTFTRAGAAYLYRGGLVLNEMVSSLQANSTSLGVTVAGSFVAGGAAVASSRSHRTNWIWKNVIQSNSKRRLWTAGVTVARSGDSSDKRPNPAGAVEFSSLEAYAGALAGRPAGTWFLTRGNGQAHYASVEGASFLQGDLIHSENLLVAGGLRADYQTRGGVLWSPRLSAAARERAFVLRAGAGVFVQDWPSNIFLRTIEHDGFHLRPFILEDVLLADAVSPSSPSERLNGASVRSRLAPHLTRPRDVMFKASVERSFGHFTPGLEYTWVNGLHVLGSRRLADQEGWLDVLESNRVRRRQQLHARLRYGWKAQSFIAHYEWVHSRDNTDGPFSFPERQDDLRAEWASTAGVSPHNFTLVGSFKLPAVVSLTLVATSRSSSPYIVTSGIDLAHNGLFNDRAGRSRNSGIGPAYKSLALYGYRRVPLPKIFSRSREKMYVDIGIQAENLLGSKNYLSFGSVIGSPLFGKPLSAFPGRSVRVWFNVGQ